MATYNVGTGSGSLTIDGKKGGYKAGDIIKVKAGKYSGLNIQNFAITDGYATIQNDGGVVEIVGSLTQAYVVCNFSAVNGVCLSGNGTAGVDKGFYFHDNKYRMISMDNGGGIYKNLTFQNLKFENIGDYTIAFGDINTAYNGTDATISSNFKFLNLEVINCNLLSGTGDITTLKGMLSGLEVANCNFHDSPGVGTLVYWAGVNNYNIHHNIINNINQKNNDHNGIFALSGNGSVHNNKCTNHQGNLVRAWGMSIGTTPLNILIYNNIICNSRKYSGFEVQSFSNYIINGKTTYANAQIFGNTCGNINLIHDWVGGVVDVYNLFGGTCDVFDNLAYNTYPANTIANQQSSLIPKVYNNLYFPTYQAAGITDEQTFNLSATSPAIGKGIVSPLLTTDYYDNIRNNPPSDGGVEYNGSVPPPTTTYYNTVQSSSFIRNNCPVGSTGSSVLYSVPAAKYSSIISQADADNKAIADITANGQTYANTNGTCTVAPVKTVTAIITIYSDGTYKVN